ncbi:MAG: hypothetical protein ACRBFS_06430 [Aureispira sp.]
MPNQHRPLDAPDIAPSYSNWPLAFWLQLLALPIVTGIPYFLYLDYYTTTIAGMSTLLVIELLTTPAPTTPPKINLRPIAFCAATAVLLGTVLPVSFYLYWITWLASLGHLLLVLYFFTWNFVSGDLHSSPPLAKILLGPVLAIFYFTLLSVGYEEFYFSSYLFLAWAAALLLLIFLLVQYFLIHKKHPQNISEQLYLVRMPQLLHLLIHASMAYYFSF